MIWGALILLLIVFCITGFLVIHQIWDFEERLRILEESKDLSETGKEATNTRKTMWD